MECEREDGKEELSKDCFFALERASPPLSPAAPTFPFACWYLPYRTVRTYEGQYSSVQNTSLLCRKLPLLGHCVARKLLRSKCIIRDLVLSSQ